MQTWLLLFLTFIQQQKHIVLAFTRLSLQLLSHLCIIHLSLGPPSLVFLANDFDLSVHRDNVHKMPKVCRTAGMKWIYGEVNTTKPTFDELFLKVKRNSAETNLSHFWSPALLFFDMLALLARNFAWPKWNNMSEAFHRWMVQLCETESNYWMREKGNHLSITVVSVDRLRGTGWLSTLRSRDPSWSGRTSSALTPRETPLIG